MIDISTQLQEIMCNKCVDSNSALFILFDEGGKYEQSVSIWDVSATDPNAVWEHTKLGTGCRRR